MLRSILAALGLLWCSGLPIKLGKRVFISLMHP